MFWALALECAPAALFGSAVAFSISLFLGVPPVGLEPAAAGAAAAGISWGVLRRFGSRQTPFVLPSFDPAWLEPEPLAEEPRPITQPTELEELLLEDLFVSAERPLEAEELLLKDVFEAPEPESSVVRLFDPREMLPTAGELRDRIEQHLRAPERARLPDASRELHEALTALRQSLR